MSNENFSQIGNISTIITGNTEDLFSERAKWIQKWITERALPFIALQALIISYYFIGTGKVVMPGYLSSIISSLILLFVALRSLYYFPQGNCQKMLGSYQVCLGFLGLLMLLGDKNGAHSLVYWGILLVGFWSVGFIYPKKWSMPGELPTIAILSSGLVMEDTAPLPGWIFVLVMVAPVIAYLQLRHQLLKPVLFLAALIVGVMICSELRQGELQIIIAIIATVVLLWVSIYSINKLNTIDSSSFTQSIGIGVTSGLLMVLFTHIIGLSLDNASTWWGMYGAFALISGLLFRKNGHKIIPLLLLWSTHWALMTFTVSFSDQNYPLYGFHFSVIIGSCFLQHFALTFNNNRLLVWARIYMVLFAFSLFLVGNEDLTINRLIFVLAVFSITIFIASAKKLASGLPWWKGVLNPRHVVAMRHMSRKGVNYVGSIPFVGATISTAIKTLQVLVKLKRDNTIHSGDVLLFIWGVCLSIFISKYVEKYILIDYISEGLAIDSSIKQNIINQISYLIAGLLFSIISLKERQPLYNLLAMVSFLLAPALIIGDESVSKNVLCLMSFIAALGVLSIFEISKNALD